MLSPRRSLPPRLVTLVTTLALAVALLAASAPDAYADKKDGRIAFEVSTDPVDLGAGQRGTLIIKGILFEKLHIYGPGDPDDQAMKYVPLEAKGVAYDMVKATISKTHDYKGEFDDEARPVWEKSFTLKVPIELSKDVKAGTRVGVSFSYYGCTDRGCYPEVKDHEAFLVLKAPPAQGPVVTVPDPQEEGGVEAEVKEGKDGKGEIIVTFVPTFGWHFYGPADDTGSTKIDVRPMKTAGVEFGEPQPEDPRAKKIKGPYKVKVPFTRKHGAKQIELEVTWAGCEGDDQMGRCNPPREGEKVGCVWPGGATEAPTKDEPKTEPTPEPEAGEALFPYTDGPVAGGTGSASVDEDDDPADDTSIVQFALIFLAGLGLAFTPCVLPIIPITVSVITGGNADIPRKRLTGLLLTYVAGLSLTFATMGVVSALAGGSMSAAFENPAVIWGIAIFFGLMAFSMIGVYELQPPSWLMNLQGGAQKRSGSFVGAFLFGCLGAVIASPCTGPAIAGLLVLTAESGNALLGFSMFFMLGLGMGTVFFAAGALNFAMRPGPWMVWVRYIFGMLLFGAALFYLKSNALITDSALWIGGGVVTLLAVIGVAWHLVKKEGEESGPARLRGAKVGVLFAVMLPLVAILAPTVERTGFWTYVRDTDHLKELVAEAKADGKPSVVDFWAQWCHYCKEYDKLIKGDPELKALFLKLQRIKVDLTDDSQRWPLRHAVGLQALQQPYMVFLDKDGRIVRGMDIKEWHGKDGGVAELKKRMLALLGEDVVKEVRESVEHASR